VKGVKDPTATTTGNPKR